MFTESALQIVLTAVQGQFVPSIAYIKGQSHCGVYD